MTKTVAELDAGGRLIGLQEVDDASGRIEVPGGTDLPLDGSYKWSESHGAFLPLGFGFERVATKPPHSLDYVVRQIVEVLGPNAGQEALDWAQWYDENLRQRDEERALYLRKAGNRRAPARRPTTFRKPEGGAS